ncbi:MAG TPA: lipopolysaccharide heptosyltransferase II [Candidatus Eisenbacteria bacterium]|nr:lipopolysaccharide heptosyltransferase II [Candidatus Eisenbacteria bacterium]
MARPLLVRLPNWLGDLVQALPVVRAAAEDPSRPAVFVGLAPFLELLKPRFPASAFLPWSRERRFAAVGAIRRHHPGTALLLTDSLSSAILMALAFVPERIGYAAEFRDAFLTRRVPRAAAARTAPRVEEYRALARAAGLAVAETFPRVEALPEERRGAAALLRRAGIPDGPFAVLAPGASYGPAKRWDPENFAKLASALARGGTRSLLVGAGEDAEPAAEVARAAGGAAYDLVGATDLGSLTGLLDQSILVASNDSGVMHLAAALGKPTVAVFGSTSPVWSAALMPWVRSLYAAYPCSPCFRRTCPIGYGCLRSIDASQAHEAAEELLAVAR